MRGITGRFVLLIGTAAVGPLVIYGLISVGSLRTGNRRTILEGNERVAAQVAEHVSLYVRNNVRILRSVGSDLGASRLERWQQDRIVKNYVLDFPEFREISLFDPDGQLVVTSRTGKAKVAVPKQVGSPDGVDIAAFKVDDDLLPTTTISIRLGRSGEEMGGLSESCRSKSCGGWSTMFASARRATRSSSATTGG